MKTAAFEVLSRADVECIHAASMEILAEVGIKVNYRKGREIFREAAAVDDQTQAVKIPESLVRWAVERAPTQFSPFGIEANYTWYTVTLSTDPPMLSNTVIVMPTDFVLFMPWVAR